MIVERTTEGDGAAETRTRLLPGGYGRSALVVGDDIPVAVRADGPWIWTEDGRRLADLSNNFAALVHGHSRPEVVDAAVKAMTSGASYGLSNEHEVAHAARLVDRLPQADQVRYTNSGTEAVMAAIRIARAATGRRKCVVLDGAYHGTCDAVLPALGLQARRGLTRAAVADTALVPINDLDALETVLTEEEPPAALLIDLLPNRLGMTMVSGEFIDRARQLCRQGGIVLIVDEVISLRLGPNGLAAELGVHPDLIVAGKLIGGGFPIGAVAGAEELMSQLNPLRSQGLEHGGTFSANRVSMAAGVAALDLLDATEIERINRLGDNLRSVIERTAADCGWQVRGRGSALRLVADSVVAEDPYRDLWWAAFRRDVLVTPSGLLTVSTAMGEEIVAAAGAALVAALQEVSEGGVEHRRRSARRAVR
jgi:glutamate-1-semialdehyde 2,1-aminomutase